MIRPELMAIFKRYSEVLTGLGVALFGLWALQARDSFFQALAALVVAAGLGIALIGWRRLRFARAGLAPGVVQIVEGQISYFGPEEGGFLALRDLVELHLIDHGASWLLIAPEGERLEIPVAAKGAEALFDAFASLPGLRIQALIDALEEPAPPPARALWLHPARAARHLRLH
ncbi:MAG: hypothetical protein LAT78_00975 [Roseinatronobacter sp.]|jgi:hypothetical protein|nr:hypothetical protein [Roseinatronobacter sp.]